MQTSRGRVRGAAISDERTGGIDTRPRRNDPARAPGHRTTDHPFGNAGNANAAAPRHAEVLIDSLAFARSIPKLKEFLPVSNCIDDQINHVLNDPDESHLSGLPSALEAQCQVQLDLMKAKPSTSLLSFILQLLVLGGVAAWLLNRFLKQTPMTSEEKAGQRYFFMFTAPCIAGLLLFTIWPLLLSFWWAQTDYNMVDIPHLRRVGAI